MRGFAVNSVSTWLGSRRRGGATWGRFATKFWEVDQANICFNYNHENFWLGDDKYAGIAKEHLRVTHWNNGSDDIPVPAAKSSQPPILEILVFVGKFKFFSVNDSSLTSPRCRSKLNSVLSDATVNWGLLSFQRYVPRVSALRVLQFFVSTPLFFTTRCTDWEPLPSQLQGHTHTHTHADLFKTISRPLTPFNSFVDVAKSYHTLNTPWLHIFPAYSALSNDSTRHRSACEERTCTCYESWEVWLLSCSRG